MREGRTADDYLFVFVHKRVGCQEQPLAVEREVANQDLKKWSQDSIRADIMALRFFIDASSRIRCVVYTLRKQLRDP